MHFPIVLAFDADLKLYVSVWMQVYAIVVVFMRIKARSLFGFYRFCFVTVVKLVCEYLLWIEANVDVHQSMRVAL